MVAYGGVDALIWLCRSSKSIKLHHLTTTILAMLAEKGELFKSISFVSDTLPFKSNRIYSPSDYNKVGITSITLFNTLLHKFGLYAL
jgi:hypothetical protein